MDPVIILAGGKGSRMGVPKGLLKIDGDYWLESQLRALQKIGASQIIVVLGHEKDRYLAALPSLAQHTVAVSTDPEAGPFASLKAGLEQATISRSGGAAWILPVDVPCPEKLTWTALEAATHTGVKAVTPQYLGKGGHPIWISSAWAARLLVLDPRAEGSRLDVRLRALKEKERARVFVNDPRVLKNMNEKSDL